MANTENKFQLARMRAEVLEGLFNKLEEDLKDASRYYGRTGEQKQKEKWNRETDSYDLVVDDNGDPVMEDVWDYIEYTEEEYARHPEYKLKAEVIKQVMKDIEKLL